VVLRVWVRVLLDYRGNVDITSADLQHLPYNGNTKKPIVTWDIGLTYDYLTIAMQFASYYFTFPDSCS